MKHNNKKAYSKHARNYLLAIQIMRKVFTFLQSISPTLTGKFAAWLWFRPAAQSRLKKPLAIFDQAEQYRFQIADKTLVCHCWGKTGPIILLLHGWSGNSRQFSTFIQPLLDEGFRVLALDAPAHGESTGKTTNALEIAQAIKKLIAEKGAVYGIITHSFGIMCASRAQYLGVNFERLIAISPPSNGIGLLEKFGHTFELNETTLTTMQAIIEQRFDKQVWQLLDLEHASNAMKMPVIIIHDEDDHDVPVSEGKALAHAWPETKIYITHGLGHRRILRSKDVVKLCLDFLISEK